MESDRIKATPLQIRVVPAERVAFYEAAEVAGLSFSGWARERLRSAARKELNAAERPVAFLEGGDSNA